MSQDFLQEISTEAEEALQSMIYNHQNSSGRSQYARREQVAIAIHKLLAQFSQYRHQSAFRKCCFGANLRGILGALCPDILHCTQEGLIKIVCEVLMDMLPSARKVDIDRLV